MSYLILIVGHVQLILQEAMNGEPRKEKDIVRDIAGCHFNKTLTST